MRCVVPSIRTNTLIKRSYAVSVEPDSNEDPTPASIFRQPRRRYYKQWVLYIPSIQKYVSQYVNRGEAPVFVYRVVTHVDEQDEEDYLRLEDALIQAGFDVESFKQLP